MMNLVPSWRRSSPVVGVHGDFDRMLDRMFEGFFEPRTLLTDSSGFTPACDVEEADNHYMLSFDLPGLKKEEIRIEVRDNHLTVSGERGTEKKEESNGRLKRYERHCGSFSRSFALPSTVDAEKVEANYENGVLQVLIPKAEAVKPRSIEIQTGKTGIFDRLLGKKETSHTDVKRVS